MISSLRRTATRALANFLKRRKFTFDGGSFTVAEGVLNPTMFRASLVFAREALRVAGDTSIRVLELGCGSGLTSVALARRHHQVTAVDKSLEAALNTAANATANGVLVRALCSDWDTGLSPVLRFDLVVTNPPFLPSPTPVFNDALWGGPDLSIIEAALKAARRHLKSDGRVLLLTSVRSGRTAVVRSVTRSGLVFVTHSVIRHWGEDLHLDLLACAPE